MVEREMTELEKAMQGVMDGTSEVESGVKQAQKTATRVRKKSRVLPRPRPPDSGFSLLRLQLSTAFLHR